MSSKPRNIIVRRGIRWVFASYTAMLSWMDTYGII